MWHKVSPQAFRIPYIKNWLSTWFSDKKEYAANLAVDEVIRSIWYLFFIQIYYFHNKKN